ncbi:MAG: TonB-dependent receptor [Pseudomonadota bacterium]
MALMIAAGPTFAQDAGLDPQDEIIVVGKKYEQSLQDVTSSVSITTAEVIAREPIADLYDIVNRIPNVVPSFGGLGFAIRGVDQRGIAGSGSTLTVYVDDSPLSNQTTFFGPLDSWDLGQVEVYKGPQSTNFGRNAIAGAIYVKTQDPSYEWDAKLRGEIGTDGIRQGAFAGGGPIVEDKLAFRVAGNWRETDGFIFNTFLDEEADATELKTGRFKLLFEPTDDFKIIATSSYTENFAGEDIIDPTGGVAGLRPDPEDVSRDVAYDTPGREGTETFIQSVNATWEINEKFELQSITTYQDTDYVRIEDFDVTPAPIAALDRAGTDEAFSQELRLKYSGDRLKAVAGFYYLDVEDTFTDEFSVPLAIAAPDFLVALNPALFSSVFIQRDGFRLGRTENYAAFLDGEFALNDQWDILFGARLDKEEQSATQTNTQDLLNVPNPLSPQEQALLGPFLGLAGTTSEATEAEFDAFLPKIGVRFKPNDLWTLGFVVQDAYRAGGSELNFATNTISEFDPEFLTNYEFSSRYISEDRKFRWNLNAYYSDWTDQQNSEPLPPPFQNFAQTVNAGQSELYGVETDVSYQILENLELYGGASYSAAQFVDFVNNFFDPSLPEGPGNLRDFDGNSFPYAPEFTFNAGFDYNHHTGFFGGVDANYQSSFFTTNENVDDAEVDDRLLVNARIGYEINEKVRLTAFAENLFDNEYFTFVNFANPTARLGDERTFAVRLDVTFN